ncbi:uncharacterized protein LOC126554459 [Aphis gossypii]|uniref:uncharacterized protein LOC126554459 n=1 Tax=Aphis gossypii TaxID=80765 RepID=UPI002158A20F|nr:uncharacterized protein LOC126554459 [Aphis gossypii]
MAPRRNRLSRAEYKKIAKLKELNLNKIVQKTIKIDTMFKKSGMVSKSAEPPQTGLTSLCNNLDTEPSCIEQSNISLESKSSEIVNPETFHSQALVVYNEKSVEQPQAGITSLCNNLDTKTSCLEQSEHINILLELNSIDIPGVLTRVCSVLKSLARHGLSFRGDFEKFGSSTSNTGNFIMMMELLAEYDPLLSEHISKYGNPGKGNTSYLSFSTYEQFIKIMSEKVINTIVDEIKTSKYFSISIDSTPDISHTDQLSFVIRYVLSNGELIERFIGFLENVGHKSENLAESVLSVLKKYNLDVYYLRGQSFDNAKTCLLTLRKSQVQERQKVLERIIETIKTIGKRGMSYRGTQSEVSQSLSNTNIDHGTSLELILLISKFDPILKSH